MMEGGNPTRGPSRAARMGSGRVQKEKEPALTHGFLSANTTSPRRADPCGATERAPESSGSYFWKRFLSNLTVESLGVDSSLAENQVLGASKYSFPIILVMGGV